MTYKLVNSVVYNVASDENRFAPQELEATVLPTEIISSPMSYKTIVSKEQKEQLHGEVLAEYVENQIVHAIADELKHHLKLEENIDDEGNTSFKVTFGVIDYNLLPDINERLENNGRLNVVTFKEDDTDEH